MSLRAQRYRAWRRGAAMALAGALGCPALAAPAPTSYTLPRPVAQALAAAALPPSSLSLYVHRVDARAPAVAVRAAVLRNPASTMKLVTTLAGLDLLGPTYTWTTGVYVAAPVRDGVLGGDLYLKGSGDPFLVTERLWKLLRAVRARGLRRVSGDLVLDGTRFDLARFDPGAFDGKPNRVYNTGPAALLMNFHAVQLEFQRSLDGTAVTLSVEPRLAGLEIDNRVRLRTGRCRGRLNIRMELTPPASPERLPGLRFSGTFPSRCRRYAFVRTLGPAPAYALALFRALWAELGGSHRGGVRTGAVPSGATLIAEQESPPLADLIRPVNKFSNNVMARNLLLTLGAERRGAPGTVEKGREAVRTWIRSLGLAGDELIVDNGAGLSRGARVSARLLGRMLLGAYHRPLMAEFVSSLALAGLDGSMRRRLRSEPLEGRAHLKTGLLDDVRSLAGYVHAGDGYDYVVVALQSHPGVDHGGGTRVQDALLRWVYAFGSEGQ